MAIAFVNETNHYDGATTQSIAAVAQNHTTGNLLVVCVRCEQGGGSIAVSSVTDTASNSYSFAVKSPYSVTNMYTEIWYAKNITGNASNIVTVTFNEFVPYKEVSVLQYSGIDTSSPFDVSGTGSGSGTSQSTSAAVTNYDDEVIVASYAEYGDGIFTPGASFNGRFDGLYIGVEDRIVSSAGSYSSSATHSYAVSWSAAHATFFAGSGASPTFAGITSLEAIDGGMLEAKWSAATGSPDYYDIFIRASSATDLFTNTYYAFSVDSDATNTYIMFDGTETLLSDGTVYHVGVRARNDSGSDSNEVSASNLIVNRPTPKYHPEQGYSFG